VEITEVKIVPVNEERLRAYVSLTFDDYFVISEIKIIRAKEGYILRMPQRKTADGFYLDVAYPIDNKNAANDRGKSLRGV